MTDVLDNPETRGATKPAQRWWNWWFSHGDDSNGGVWRDGDATNPACDPTAYPSRDAAETVANDQLERMRLDQGPFLLTYLGAFPDGERP